jgi:hypothetical protein
VASYGFNETSGTTATDKSGRGNTGTISGATRVTGGKHAGALSFNGTNNYVRVADSASLDLTNGMTLEAWVQPTTSDKAWRTVVLKEHTTGLAYSLYSNDDTARPGTSERAAGAGRDTSTAGTAALPANKWSHVAATFDGGTLRIYVNGALVGSKALGGSLAVGSGPLKIGGNAVWGEWFKGLIDDVRVYNRALSTADIAADMNASA